MMEGERSEGMFDVKAMLEQELRYQQNLKQIYLGKRKGLPNGCLSASNVRGKNYYYNRVNGERVYLGCEKDGEIAKMKSHMLLSELLKRIEHNEKLIRRFLTKYQEIQPEIVRQSLGKVYQDAEVDPVEDESMAKDDWGYQPYQRNTKYSEGLVHRTLKGDYVRSKSEVVIANTLHMMGLQYRSEELTKVGNHVFAPDFKIKIPETGKIKLLEHFGMMHDEEYREKALWKISTYIENGYRPYEDILFTFDDVYGNIDAKNLNILIMNFCKA